MLMMMMMMAGVSMRRRSASRCSDETFRGDASITAEPSWRRVSDRSQESGLARSGDFLRSLMTRFLPQAGGGPGTHGEPGVTRHTLLNTNTQEH